MKTSSKPTVIPGRTPPAPANPKAQQGGTPMVRAKRGPGEWNPTSWNSRRPETATLKPQALEEGSEDGNPEKKKPSELIDYEPVDKWPEKVR